MSAARNSYDVVVVGGGHNGLTAAAYLATAGFAVLVLEEQAHTGGAAITAEAFPGVPARLSRFSYLVSLLPDRIARELDLAVELRSRPTASYSPAVRDGRHVGLFVERSERAATQESFRQLTGSDEEYAAWRRFYSEMDAFAQVVAPTMLEPLPAAGALRAEIGEALWHPVVERPLGELIEARFTDDLVRGVVATDGLIGTFATMDDPSLVQNRCFLYHLIGNGTGEWRVPVGGMGAVTTALARAASRGGAEILTNASVRAVDDSSVTWSDSSGTHSVRSRLVLANVAPFTVAGLLGQPPPPKPEGAQLKINFLLSRLPRLKSGQPAEQAFAGTFHVAEEYTALAQAHDEAISGTIPRFPPGEFYCHSLTDPSILGAMRGVHTLTYFGLHMPATLFATDRAAAREEAVRRALAAVDVHLEEPLLDCVLRGPDGSLCIEAKVPQDVEEAIGMPGGHIFHGDLAWPWAGDEEVLETPAQRWGVETSAESVLLCGAGARRGGGVSGIGGHNAAQAALELLGG